MSVVPIARFLATKQTKIQRFAEETEKLLGLLLMALCECILPHETIIDSIAIQHYSTSVVLYARDSSALARSLIFRQINLNPNLNDQMQSEYVY